MTPSNPPVNLPSERTAIRQPQRIRWQLIVVVVSRRTFSRQDRSGNKTATDDTSLSFSRSFRRICSHHTHTDDWRRGLQLPTDCQTDQRQGKWRDDAEGKCERENRRSRVARKSQPSDQRQRFNNGSVRRHPTDRPTRTQRLIMDCRDGHRACLTGVCRGRHQAPAIPAYLSR